MRKTNKNLTKQILTLVLTFVMVFTGMGIGSWGVDTAWADENNTSTISNLTSENLGNPIGKHNETDVYFVKTYDTKFTMENTAFGKETVSYYIDPDDNLGDNLVNIDSRAGTYFIQKDSENYKTAVQSYEKNAKSEFSKIISETDKSDYLFILVAGDISLELRYLIIEWSKEMILERTEKGNR